MGRFGSLSRRSSFGGKFHGVRHKFVRRGGAHHGHGKGFSRRASLHSFKSARHSHPINRPSLSRGGYRM